MFNLSGNNKVQTLQLLNSVGTFFVNFTSYATANRTILLPDKDGTIALLSDISGSTTYQAIIDIGNIPTFSIAITYTDSNVLTTHKINSFIQAKYNSPIDELEFDNPIVNSNCSVNGTINFFVSCNTAISGQYIINYSLS